MAAKKPTASVAFSLPPPRPERSVSLMELSGGGQMAPSLADALKYPERARNVELDGPPGQKLGKLRKLHKLDSGGVKLGPWLAPLKHLRSLVAQAPNKTLPRELLALPRLRFLHLDYGGLADTTGITKLRSLEFVTLGGTPAEDDEPALPKRAPAAPPRDRKKLIAAVKADTLDDGANLRGVDLSGQTFEDLYITYDLRKAKLANTTWLRCDFEWGTLEGADLRGATFDDCHFSTYTQYANLAKVDARGATFVGCGGDLDFTGADLRDAKLLSVESDSGFTLDKIKGAGLQLQLAFISEKEHRITAKGADLRGAHAEIDVTSERRAEIKKKKSGRFAWKQDHFRGAKTDKTTRILYAPLTDDVQRGAPSTVDPAGPAAISLGRIDAINASLWAVAFDAKAAAAWQGVDEDRDGEDDFTRALDISDGPIKAGTAKGHVFQINVDGWSDIWRVPGGIALLDASIQDEDNDKRATQLMALRVTQWPVPKKTKRLGTVTVTSGALALMLPYVAGTATTAELTKAKKQLVSNRDGDRVLVPLPNGTYTITRHAFSPDGSEDYEDEVGRYSYCYRITK